MIVMLTAAVRLASAEPGEAIRIYDGDTLSIMMGGQKLNVRLYGIDAPQNGQPGYVSATRFLKRLISGHPLEVTVLKTDRAGQSHAIVVRNGKESSVNAAMVANGYAWVNPRTCQADPCRYWKHLQSQARSLKLGIWTGYDLIPPWEFKRPGQ